MAIKLVRIPLLCDDNGCRDELGEHNIIGYWEVFPDREPYYREVRKHSAFYCSYHWGLKQKQAKENKKPPAITL